MAGQVASRLPRSPDQVEEGLRHHLVYAVVVAVVKAVYVAQLPVPACLLTVAYPTLGEARYSCNRHTNCIPLTALLESQRIILVANEREGVQWTRKNGGTPRGSTRKRTHKTSRISAARYAKGRAPR